MMAAWGLDEHPFLVHGVDSKEDSDSVLLALSEGETPMKPLHGEINSLSGDLAKSGARTTD